MPRVIYLLVALSAIASQPALAAPVRVDFSGSVQTLSGEIIQSAGEPIPISEADAEAALGGSVQVGTPFSGFLVYDDSSIPTSSSPENAGSVPGSASASYYWQNPTQYFLAHGEIGSFVGDGNVSQGSWANGQVYDNELYLNGAQPSSVYFTAGLSSTAAPPGGMGLTTVEFAASGASPGAPLHGTSLHSIPWNIESFPLSSAAFFFRNGDLGVQVEGAVTRLVPEPAPGGLAALAALALALRRRRSEFR